MRDGEARYRLLQMTRNVRGLGHDSKTEVIESTREGEEGLNFFICAPFGLLLAAAAGDLERLDFVEELLHVGDNAAVAALLNVQTVEDEYSLRQESADLESLLDAFVERMDFFFCSRDQKIVEYLRDDKDGQAMRPVLDEELWKTNDLMYALTRHPSFYLELAKPS